jgi:hypothetical protein
MLDALPAADPHRLVGRYLCHRGVVAYSSRGKLPAGLTAFYDDQLCGVAALEAHPLGAHPHLAPWAAAGLVLPQFRSPGSLQIDGAKSV